MAQMVRCRAGLFSVKYANQTVSRLFVPVKYQRSWFHTSWILDVKGKELLMPSLSPTMESGTIVKWLKKEGDNIQPGDAVADIQTDKAVVTMEMDDEGILAKIVVTEGSKDIKVGTLIALTVEEGEDWKSVELPSDAATSVSSASATTEAAPPSTPAISSEPPPPGQQNIAMPALSPTMTSGTIVKWLKKEGDEIEPGDALADIQTDKAVMSFEVDEEAILAKILIPEGSQVEVGQLIAITMEKGSDWKTAVVPAVTKAATAPTSESTVSKPSPSTAAAPASPQPPPSGQVYGLAVKRLLEEYGLSSGSIKGTGRPNRLLKSDVLAHIEANHLQKVIQQNVPALEESKKVPGTGPTSSPTVKPPGKGSSYIDIEVSNIRAVIAKRLGESKANIPHSYATVDVQIDKLNELRSKLKADNVNVSVNDLITKAVAHALLECPDVNSLYKNGQVMRAQKVDISVAVSTPTGLITPIVFDTPSKSLADIASNIRDLAGRAREGKLKPQEFQGGSFTISNLGMFGIKEFSAIINPPQTAILAVGGGRVELSPSLTKSTKMTATLSYDARAIDEDQAAEFLSLLRSILEEPVALTVAKSRALRHRRE